MSTALIYPLTDMVNCLEKAVEISENQFIEISNRNKLPLNGVEGNIREHIKVYWKLSHESYWNINKHVLKNFQKSANDIEEVAFYFQIQMRTLIEILARNLEVAYSPPEQQIKLILADQLFFISKYYKLANSKEEKERYSNIDKETREQIKDIIKKYNIEFPTKEEFSKTKLEKLGLSFMKVEKSLEKFMDEFTKINSSNKIKGNELYVMYQYYSDLVHGSRFNFMANSKTYTKNSVVLILLLLNRIQLELLDAPYLRNKFKGNISEWKTNVTKYIGDFQLFWDIGREYYDFTN